MVANSSGREHWRLCLQLILQSHLHQLDAGLTEKKVYELCRELKLRDIPGTHDKRLVRLQEIAPRILGQLR